MHFGPKGTTRSCPRHAFLWAPCYLVTARPILPAIRVVPVDVHGTHHSHLAAERIPVEPLQLKHGSDWPGAERQNRFDVFPERWRRGFTLLDAPLTLAKSLHFPQPVCRRRGNQFLGNSPAPNGLDPGEPAVDNPPAPSEFGHPLPDSLQALRRELRCPLRPVQFLQRTERVAVMNQFPVIRAIAVFRVFPERQQQLVDRQAGHCTGASLRRRIASLVRAEQDQDAGVFLLALGRIPRSQQDVVSIPGHGSHRDDSLAAGMTAVGRGSSLLRSWHGIARLRKNAELFRILWV